MAAYFDKIDVCETLAHEVAAVCMAEGLLKSPDQLRGRLPFRELLGDPFDTQRRAIVPTIATQMIQLRRYPAEPSFLVHWRCPQLGGYLDVSAPLGLVSHMERGPCRTVDRSGQLRTVVPSWIRCVAVGNEESPTRTAKVGGMSATASATSIHWTSQLSSVA